MNIIIHLFFFFNNGTNEHVQCEMMTSNSQRITTQLCRSPHLFSLFFFGNVFPVLLINLFSQQQQGSE